LKIRPCCWLPKSAAPRTGGGPGQQGIIIALRTHLFLYIFPADVQMVLCVSSVCNKVGHATA
jgi:hypothetical protein